MYYNRKHEIEAQMIYIYIYFDCSTKLADCFPIVVVNGVENEIRVHKSDGATEYIFYVLNNWPQNQILSFYIYILDTIFAL